MTPHNWKFAPRIFCALEPRRSDGRPTRAPRALRTVALATFALLAACSDGVAPIPAPTLTSLTPTSGVRGGIAVVTLTGTNFIAGSTSVEISGVGVLVESAQVASPTTVLVVFDIEEQAEVGARDVTVSTPRGLTEALTFTVEAGEPTLSSVAPDGGVEGTSVPVTLTGGQFIPGATQVLVSGSGVTVSDVQVTSVSTLTATFTIAAGADLGDRNVTVTTVAGTSEERTFAVRPPAPTLTALSDTTGAAGTTVSQTMTGTNFVSGATVAVSGTGVTVSNVQVVSDTSITANFQIAAGATQGNRTVSVTTAGGTSNALAFTVGPPLPSLNALSVTEAVAGAVVSQVLTGTNFLPGSTVTVDGTGVTVTDVVIVNATRINATFTIGGAAAPGPRNVRVVSAGGSSNARTFTITAQAPTLTALAPDQGAVGLTVNVTLTGTNFVTDSTTVLVSGDGVTVGTVNVTSGTTLIASFVVAPTAVLGARDVTIETPGGTAGPQTFTVVGVLSIDNFTATPPSITAGGSTQLAWTVSNATTCSIDQGIGVVACNDTLMVSPATSTTYNLTATGGGGTILRPVTVTVTP